jgi:hypothetical protein
MEVYPIKKSLLEEAKNLGIEQIILSFSGGHDEGYLDVSFDGGTYNSELAEKVEDWVWSVYSYSGAGDGSEYGDNIVYDLKEGKVYASEWYTSRVEEAPNESELEVEEEE